MQGRSSSTCTSASSSSSSSSRSSSTVDDVVGKEPRKRTGSTWQAGRGCTATEQEFFVGAQHFEHCCTLWPAADAGCSSEKTACGCAYEPQHSNSSSSSSSSSSEDTSVSTSVAAL
uniref:Uncharacterized protein n=1 Tax=Tetradesmus obliquus TaxID=3088 RepID=A0A383VRK9_TETOB